MVKCRRLYCLPSLSFYLSLIKCDKYSGCAYPSWQVGEKRSQFQQNYKASVRRSSDRMRRSSDRVRRSSERARRSSDRVRPSSDRMRGTR